ncbi:MAG: ATP-dependent DNA helicase RecG [Patescibacteria group bacterium]|nr:ATP-dependent DNA helicase RecG [Patescibacteria group bacterium]
MPITLDSTITDLPGVGDSYAQKLEKLGVNTARDLLLYFPRRWEDFSHVTKISDVKAGEQVSVKGVIFDIGTKRSKRGMPVTEAVITDDSGSAKAVWFNQPYLEGSLKKGDEIYLAGKMEWGFGQLNFVSPAYEKAKEAEDELRHTGRIVPIYPETAGVTSKWIRTKVGGLTKLIYNLKDHLPDNVKKRHDLLDLSAAVRTMHFPESIDELKKAQKRFLYDDLFCLLLSVLANKKELEKNKAITIKYNEAVGKKFVDSLPYDLTNAQRKAAWEILKDIARPIPANRLLEGDVGSGKTVVAAMAALMTANAGYQVAILAPTEILARQHYESFKSLLSSFKDIEVVLLTGSMTGKEKEDALLKIKNGDVQIVVGTHAILSENVEFWTLALVIVDEQHRFGVAQRMKLKKANGETDAMPHFLSMSATPIPRTLAITVFGDLTLSVLDEMPPGREKVDTHIVPPAKRTEGYRFIDQRIEEGRQVFVICPLISASDKLGVKSVVEEADNLKKVFSKRKVGLLHGKLKPAEKEKVMNDFKEGKLDILVSTSVIEVGVDVPNASIMVIEGADRFGLASLHQFRGRVGRGKHKSYCFLFTDSKNEKTLERLNALSLLNNGFELAEKDLELRGPGELLGVKQSGKIDSTMMRVLSDPLIIKEVRETAEKFIVKENLDDYPKLKEKVAEFEVAAKLE